MWAISEVIAIPGSACHMDDEQGKGRDTQTGLVGKGCISYNLWFVQRNSAAHHNVLVSHCLSSGRELGARMRREQRQMENHSENLYKTFTKMSQSSLAIFMSMLHTVMVYLPCLWVAGLMLAAPSFVWFAVCWSSSSWIPENPQQFFAQLCHLGFAASTL